VTAEELLAQADAAAANAYAPYSNYHVGAAVLARDGCVFVGANVENAAYPLGNCAEASAIAAGVRAEGSAFRIAETAVWALDREGRAIGISPCGGCRQRIREFATGGGVAVHFPWQGGAMRTASIDDLLPYAFELPSSRSGR
jgi:cytidine deaminase